MKVLLERLANYWQFRFVTIASCLALAIYAMVMPVHSTESVNISTIVSDHASLDRPQSAVKPALDHPSFYERRASETDTSQGPPFQGERPQNEADQDKANQDRADHDGANRDKSNQGKPDQWAVPNPAVVRRLEQAVALYQSRKLPRDASDLIRTLRRTAERGDVTAEFLLGEAYQTGLGVPKDMTENVRWYARALGQPASTLNNGSPPNIPKSYAEALARYRQIADEGDAIAELYLALSYDLGNGVSEDAAEAARWYRKAAAQGSASAACDLGELYLEGNGLPKDDTEATKWLSAAAARGSANAQYSLGRLDRFADGASKDNEVAARWLEKAASQGNVPAQVLLSEMYASGTGVPRNTAKAYMWINLAAAGDPQLKDIRDGVEVDISGAEMTEGQKMIHEWLSQHRPVSNFS